LYRFKIEPAPPNDEQLLELVREPKVTLNISSSAAAAAAAAQ
jgi:hypothetical protein